MCGFCCDHVRCPRCGGRGYVPVWPVCWPIIPAPRPVPCRPIPMLGGNAIADAARARA